MSKKKTLRVGDYNLSREVLAETFAGKIIKAQYIPQNTILTIKMISLKQAEKKEAFDNEARIIHVCNGNPNAIPVHKIFTQESHGFVSMALFDMTLHDLILQKKRLSGRRAVGIFRQIVQGVGYMHERNIAHLNLCTYNILMLYREGTAYVSDFGRSFFLETNQRVDEGLFQLGERGEEGFQAPEVLVPGSFYNPVFADIWSLGVILLCMITGFLFSTDTILAELDQIAGIAPNCRDLLKQMIVPDPKRRISIREILEHSFIAQYVDTPKTPRSPIGRIRSLIVPRPRTS